MHDVYLRALSALGAGRMSRRALTLDPVRAGAQHRLDGRVVARARQAQTNEHLPRLQEGEEEV